MVNRQTLTDAQFLANLMIQFFYFSLLGWGDGSNTKDDSVQAFY